MSYLVFVWTSEDLEKDVEFEVVGDAPDKAPTPPTQEDAKNIANGNKDSAEPSTSSKGEHKTQTFHYLDKLLQSRLPL